MGGTSGKAAEPEGEYKSFAKELIKQKRKKTEGIPKK
jgi:hypothetical protein